MKQPLCLFFAAILAWDPSPSPQLTGYNVFYGTNSGSYQIITMIGKTNQLLISAPPGNWYASIAAVSTNQVAYSTEVQFSVIEVSQEIQEAEFIDGPWTTRTNQVISISMVVTNGGTQKFFRGVVGVKR